MSTNRTKIDWAYKQAERVVDRAADYQPGYRTQMVREIAAILRRVEKRGRTQGMRATEPARDELARRKSDE